jgi:hypothetical protein
MAAVPSDVLACWHAPAWAEASEVDEAAVIHSRRLGSCPGDDGQHHDVWLLQRDEINEPTERVSCTRGPAYMVFAGGSLLPGQVEEFVQMLRTGLQVLSDPPDGSAAAQLLGSPTPRAQRTSAQSWPCSKDT